MTVPDRFGGCMRLLLALWGLGCVAGALGPGTTTIGLRIGGVAVGVCFVALGSLGGIPVLAAPALQEGSREEREARGRRLLHRRRLLFIAVAFLVVPLGAVLVLPGLTDDWRPAGLLVVSLPAIVFGARAAMAPCPRCGHRFFAWGRAGTNMWASRCGSCGFVI